RAGLAVTVLGPASTRAAFCAGASALPGGPGAGAGMAFRQVEISGRPRPVLDVVAGVRLGALLRRARPDVVHAHGLRAGALAAVALAAGRRARRPALVVTVHNAPPPGRLA